MTFLCQQISKSNLCRLKDDLRLDFVGTDTNCQKQPITPTFTWAEKEIPLQQLHHCHANLIIASCRVSVLQK